MKLETIRRKFPLTKRVRSPKPSSVFVIGVVRNEETLDCWGLERVPDQSGHWRAAAGETQPGIPFLSDAEVFQVFTQLMVDSEKAVKRQRQEQTKGSA
jgi:hypothetical protein